MEAAGLEFTLAESTARHSSFSGNAASPLSSRTSDVGRAPVRATSSSTPFRRTDQATPFFIYGGASAPAHREETAARGAQGTTNRPDELVEMVVTAVGATVPRR